MEMITCVKSETNPVRRLFSSMESDHTNPPSPKLVKRRRREPPPSDQSNCNLTLTTTTTTTTVKRSSRFRGVSRHRWTGRYEAHLWDKGSWNVTQRKKGKQVYLGAYNEEEAAARAYDLAAIKYWGPATFINFPVSDYEIEIEAMKNQTREEYLASLRRRSSGFSRGMSKYRGVARHHHNGRWEARIGRVFGNKYLYLGTYNTQEEAAHAYDIAAIEYRGINAVTNFDLSTYIRWLRPSEPNSNQTTTDQPRLIDYKGTSSNNEKTEFSFLSNFHGIKEMDFHQKKELDVQTKIDLNSSSSSNPNKSSTTTTTALGLLFRSSMFKELVEKNSKVINGQGTEETDDPMSQTGFYKRMGGFSLPIVEKIPEVVVYHNPEQTWSHGMPLPQFN
ncbi:ethylene-responsive transcription factor WRI1-like [Impatiens glandulifera]|uniref:ethylene-responsive transcription factor WRI1-like n=1 Tax=Impatiens glandulifera TaxID=253017 RepID=UPI001FB0A847|nr:ethylene-responsive transcription factor WRI1-like [Impatiens glandulifera]